jgi:hypothetical protein
MNPDHDRFVIIYAASRFGLRDFCMLRAFAADESFESPRYDQDGCGSGLLGSYTGAPLHR